MGTYLKTKDKQLKNYGKVTDFQGSTNTPMNKTQRKTTNSTCKAMT